MKFWASKKQECLLAPFYYFLVTCSQEHPGCHFHQGSHQEKDQLLIFRFCSSESHIQFCFFPPIFSILKERLNSMYALVQSSIRHYTRFMPYFGTIMPIWYAEDDNKSSYSLSTCCELSIYISNFKYSLYPARTVLDPCL